MTTKKLILTLVKSFLVCIISVSVAFISPVQRPFLCGDISLSHPKMKDTVSNLAVYLWGLSPIVIIFMNEVFLTWEKFASIKKILAGSWTKTAYLYEKYLVNFSLSHPILFGAKVLTGKHRPHFFETCMPDTLPYCKIGTYVYNFNCTNEKIYKLWVNDASQSFFSGHAMIACNAAFFLIFYFQSCLKKNRFMKSLIQVILILIAYFISVSRVFDMRHWVSDVIAGGIFGVLFAMHAWFIQSKSSKAENAPSNSNEASPLNLP